MTPSRPRVCSEPLRCEAAEIAPDRARRQPGAARDLGRREVAGALAALAAWACLGRPRPAFAGGGYDDPDSVKQYLHNIKDLVCAVKDLVAGEPGPLTDPDDIAFVRYSIVSAAEVTQKMLTEPSSLLFTPPDAWLFWMPIDFSDANLEQTANITCQLACDTLEEYCNQTGNENEYLWQVERAYCHILARGDPVAVTDAMR